jgi:hypothetical protein
MCNSECKCKNENQIILAMFKGERVSYNVCENLEEAIDMCDFVDEYGIESSVVVNGVVYYVNQSYAKWLVNKGE